MSQKIIIILWSLTLTKGGIIGTEFTTETSNSTPSVFQSESTKLNTVQKLPNDYVKTYGPSPLRESTLTTVEGKLKTINRTENAIYSKSRSTAYQNNKKAESRTTENSDFIQSNIPTIYSPATHQEPVFYDPQIAQSIPTSITHEISTPIVTESTYIPTSYETNLNNLKTTTSDKMKTLPTSDSEISSLNLKSSSSSLSYYSHPSELEKTSITYSDAPLVSHMIFKGLGVSYGW